MEPIDRFNEKACEMEWVNELTEITKEASHEQYEAHESQHHYKKYNVFKVFVDSFLQPVKQHKIVFNVPKWEAEMILRQQKSKTLFDKQGEIAFMVNYKVEESEYE